MKLDFVALCIRFSHHMSWYLLRYAPICALTWRNRLGTWIFVSVVKSVDWNGVSTSRVLYHVVKYLFLLYFTIPVDFWWQDLYFLWLFHRQCRFDSFVYHTVQWLARSHLCVYFCFNNIVSYVLKGLYQIRCIKYGYVSYIFVKSQKL